MVLYSRYYVNKLICHQVIEVEGRSLPTCLLGMPTHVVDGKQIGVALGVLSV